MGTHKINANLDVDGEVQGTSLDINGNADISGTLTSVTYQGDVIASAYLDSDTAHLSGAQTISGIKTFSGGLILDDSSGAAPIIKWRNGNDDEFSIFNNANGKLIFQQDSTTRLTLDSNGATVAGGVTINDDALIGNATNDDIITLESSGNVLFTYTAQFEDNADFNGKVDIDRRRFSITSGTDGNAIGDVVYFGSTTGMTIGKIYYYTSSGTWALADADSASTAKGMLGVALGTASNSHGVLLRGMVTIANDPGNVGEPVFLSTTAGAGQSSAPTGNGDIVRVIGYSLHATNGAMYFNPDNTFVEVSA